jgi:predicted metal-binding membrane protein
VAGLLLLVAALAWAFTVHQAILMDEMDAAMWRDMNMSMNGMQPSWNAVDAVMLFVMWSAMMAAMMIPGASPIITAFATINRRRRARAAPYVPTAAFLIGYLIVWTGFSVIATALQWLLQANRLLDQCSGFCCLGLTEIAEGDDRRAALVYNVEPDAREGASIIPRRLNLA